MNITNINSIQIPLTRQRQDFEPESLMELTTSIETIGLLHAPVLRSTSEGLVLVAGERRIKAIRDLWALGGTLSYNGEAIPEDSIPYITLGELSELDAEEAELDENLKRRDLTWQELADAHERLHKLREKQTVITETPSGSPHPESWTVADTAKELTGHTTGSYHDKVRRELIVAKHLDDPEVASAKSLDEAFKILKRQENTAQNIKLAKEVGKTFSADIHEVYNEDCIEWGRDPAKYSFCNDVDVLLCDPPYGMGADKFGNAAGKLSNIEHHYSDSYENWQELMLGFTNLSFKITKPQAHAYIFCDFDRFHELKSMMQDAGWYVFRTPILHLKPNSGRVPLPDQGPRRQWECILYAIKGKKPVTYIYPDIISTNADEQLSHGAQKPVELYKNLLRRSVHPGDIVLDCFAGTGPIIPAAHSFQCKAIAIEQSKEYYAICVERLKKLEEK